MSLEDKQTSELEIGVKREAPESPRDHKGEYGERDSKSEQDNDHSRLTDSAAPEDNMGLFIFKRKKNLASKDGFDQKFSG